jgi:shikimate 5-dehydrogenase
VPREALTGQVVYDLVYNPRETTLVRWARESGRVGIGGLEMLVSQAMRQFTWWTGASVHRGVFETAANRVLDRVWGE